MEHLESTFGSVDTSLDDEARAKLDEPFRRRDHTRADLRSMGQTNRRRRSTAVDAV